LPILQIFWASLAAFIAGFVDAIAGGGGIITVPALLACGLPAAEVLGTNKLVGTTGTSMAAWSFWYKKKAVSELLVMAVPFTIVGAALGSQSVTLLPSEYFKPLVTLLTFLLALYFFLRPKLGMLETYDGLNPKIRRITLAGAFGLGFYDGIFGPGTGAFLTFLFVRLVGLDFLRAAACTKVLNLASNAVALSLFLWHGVVVFSLGIPMALANMCGNYCGAHSAMKGGAGLVRWVFIVMAVILGCKMLY
jgi:uncharacterized membrane protein YfcA